MTQAEIDADNIATAQAITKGTIVRQLSMIKGQAGVNGQPARLSPLFAMNPEVVANTLGDTTYSDFMTAYNALLASASKK